MAIWPIEFTLASNKVQDLYADIETSTQTIIRFLTSRCIKAAEITLNAPAITYKSTQQYGGSQLSLF